MKIHVGHVWCYVEGEYNDYLKSILIPVTSYFVEGYFFSKSFKKGFWDGRHKYIKYDRSRRQYYFPTGFLARVTGALDAANYFYELFDDREYMSPEPVYTLHPTIRLDQGKYAFQAQVLNKALLYSRGIIKVATGGGKTEIAAALIKSFGRKTIWLTHRINLLDQTRARLAERLQVPIGVVGGGHFQLEEVTVCTVQTLQAAYTNLCKAADPKQDPPVTAKPDYIELWSYAESCEVVIGDEVHHLEADQWWDCFCCLPAPYRYGLTATPNLEGVGLNLLGMTGGIIAEVAPLDLMEIGVLAKPKIWFVDINEPRIIKTKKNEKGKRVKRSYAEIYREGIVDNVTRTAMTYKVAFTFKQEGKSTLVLVKQIRHGETLADFFNFKGIRTRFVRGETSSEGRSLALAELQEGFLDCIVATNIFNEGQDIPGLQAVINATGSRGGGNAKDGDSGRTTIQILGRGTRAHGDKTSFDYVDFSDRTHPYLLQASLDRVQTLESEGYTPFINYWANYVPEVGEVVCMSPDLL